MLKSSNLHLQSVKKDFSDASGYAALYQQNNPTAHFFNTRLRRVAELIGDVEINKVLDMGCGPCMIGSMFNCGKTEYYGVDLSEEMIKECISRFGHTQSFRFSVAEIEKLPFPDSCFDLVLCLGALEYVLESNVAISEMARVVRPGGIVVATMLNGISPYRLWEGSIYKKLKHIRNAIGRLRRFRSGISNVKATPGLTLKLISEKAFAYSLTSAGLKIEDVVYYDFNLALKPLDVRFPRLAVSLSRKLEFLCRSKLKLLGTGFIMKGRKI